MVDGLLVVPNYLLDNFAKNNLFKIVRFYHCYSLEFAEGNIVYRIIKTDDKISMHFNKVNAMHVLVIACKLPRLVSLRFLRQL